jgi:pimeloyl-ACP methyl ester carboxylesterase
MDQKPTVLFVHGAWHTNEPFAEVQQHLASAGYGIKNVQLPSSTPDGPYVQGIDDDVEVIRNALNDIVLTESDIVVVMHSYGAIPGSSAARGFSRAERHKQGKDGGIIDMVYMAAMVCDEGISLKARIGGKLGSWITVHVGSTYRSSMQSLLTRSQSDTSYMTSDTEAHDIFYNDIPKEEADKWIAKLNKQATKSFGDPCTYAAWKHIPSTYILCGKDNAIPIQAQELFIGQDGADFKTERFENASHSPFLSMPKETADAIKRAAGEKV